MSRWLKQVNNLLENLDDQVGDAVEQAEERLEEAAYEYSGSSAGAGSAPTSSGLGVGVGDLSASGARAAAAVSTFAGAVASPGVRGLASKSSVNDILARRGLLGDDDEEDEEDGGGDGEQEEAAAKAMGGDIADGGNDFGTQPSPGAAPLSGMSSVTQEQTAQSAPPAALATGLEPPSSSTEEDESSPTGADAGAISSDPSGWEDDGNDFADLDNVDDGRGGDTTDDGGFSSAVVVDSTDGEEDDSSDLDPSSASAPAPAPATGAKTTPPSIDLAAAAVSKAVESAEARARVEEMEAQMFYQANEAKRAAQQAQEAEKELRKLRRHVVKLNSELEAAESEVDAQRIELERAAERMERDRTRNKEEKERVARERKEEREAAVAEHKAALDSMAARHADRIADMEEQVLRANEAREQEGGDWNKELEDALERERDVVKKMMELEEEKETLTNQVSTLQTQMTALETRLGSVTELSETATEREREADDRLDAALSLHARQLSQRQAREAELERTVAELGAALAVARQKEQARGIGGPSGIGSTGTTSDEGGNQNSSLRAQLETAEEEIETLKTQLMLEQQRCETFQQELQEITQERTEEASAIQAKQKQYDRQVTDMTAEISRLQTSLRDLRRTPSSMGDGGSSDGTSASEVSELKKRVATLSQLVVQHQSKIDDSKVEISTLRSRLRTATSRAEAAEKAMTMSGNATDLSELERGGTYTSKMRRRRGKPSPKSRSSSIRSAMKLDPGRGGSEAHEAVGMAIDALDRWSVETGAYLRTDPLARGVFLLYLVLLHLWALFLLFFHVHNDLDAGGYAAGGVGHGPHAMMQQQAVQLN